MDKYRVERYRSDKGTKSDLIFVPEVSSNGTPVDWLLSRASALPISGRGIARMAFFSLPYFVEPICMRRGSYGIQSHFSTGWKEGSWDTLEIADIKYNC